MRTEDLKRVLPLWIKYTEDVRADPDVSFPHKTSSLFLRENSFVVVLLIASLADCCLYTAR